LKEARVLVVGAGGLGCPVLLYLAAAGVGTIGIVDHDLVSESNLQRQILFGTADIGLSKVMVASRKLKELNPLCSFRTHSLKLDSKNALKVLAPYDIIVDGSDNFPTRYLVNDACILLNKPLVHGSVLEFEGQVAVFNVNIKNSFTANYRDIFPMPPAVDSVPNCEQAGVMGVLPGLVGSIMTNEVIKFLIGLGDLLINKLFIINSLTLDVTTIKINKQNSTRDIKNLIDYDEFCGLTSKKDNTLDMKEITVQELQELKQLGKEYQLIDVREPHEFDICNIGGELIPLAEIPNNVEKISKTKQVVIHCRSGARSGQAIKWLTSNHQFDNLYNLKGGILAWANEIDNSMPTY
jgi:sulfur-carrier protein adenylyltransferase/sulfurtransferase